MNRIYSVFILTALSCTCSFAQQSTNIVGSGSEMINFVDRQFSGSGDASTNDAANVENVATLNVSGSTFNGGVGGAFVGLQSIITENGGGGLLLNDVGDITIVDSEFYGGMGGEINTLLSSFSYALGGHGLEVIDSAAFPVLSGSSFIGGAGGTILNEEGRARAFGGDGVNMVKEYPQLNIIIDGGTYAGGDGGNVLFNSDETVSVAQMAILEINGARGGNGLRISRADELPNGSTLIINDGHFSGARGGTAENIGVGSVNADGGSGLFIEYMEVTINGGEFYGADAGTANGLLGVSGAGAHLKDGDVIINGGEFYGNVGLRVVSFWEPIIATINGGKFTDVEFTTVDNLFYTGSNDITISGGIFNKMTFNGAGINSVLLTGGTIEDIEVEGVGTTILSMSTNVASSGIVTQSGGMVNVNLWADHHFTNTTVADGTMNFNTQLFTLGDGASFSLLDQGAAVNFNDGLLAKPGSSINIVYDGTSSTAIEGTGLTFEEGVNWTIDGGATAIVNGDTVVMAIDSAPSLVASTNVSYVNYVGSGGSWMGGITSLEASATQLIGTYGFVSLNKALGTTPGSDFDNAMTDLSAFLASNDFEDDANYTEFKGMGDAADVILTDAYVRTPEMASTLIQLQGVFADQIKDRTRSHLRQQEWGTTTASAPQGAQGPNAWDSSMDWLNDHLPKWDAREAMDKDVPPKSAKVHATKTPRSSVTLPATYQVWGRAYGSRIEQDATSGFGGYDANVGGGVMGLDKTFDHMLIGLGGGYAHTTLDGNWGSRGEADTGYGTVYAAVTGEKLFFDFNVNYAFNDVETESSPIMQYSGDYTASSAGIYVGGGMGIDMGRVLITPEVSLLTTYYDRDSYTETSAAVGPYPDKEWDAYSQWSYLSALGVTASMIGQIDSFSLDMEFRPEVRAHWLHEFNADMDDPTYIQVGGVNTVGVSLQAREEDLLKVGAGVRFSKWDSDTLEFGVDVDGAFGQDYAAYMISGKLLHRF